MPPKSDKRRRRRSTEQPPNRGRGSKHATKQSGRRKPDLRANTLAEGMRARLREEGGPRNPLEAMAQDSLANQDSARAQALQRARERREKDQSAGRVAPVASLSPQDRTLIFQMTVALRENTAALRESMAMETAERAPSEDTPPDAPADGDGEKGVAELNPEVKSA